MNNSFISWQALLPGLLLFAGCGPEDAEPTPVADESQARPMGGACGGPAVMTRSPSAVGARVFFITPSDSDTVSSPVQLEFGLSGMELVPSGTDRPDSGHHHIIIDHDLPNLSLPVPADAQHVHFGDGRSQTDLDLAPGRHTLQLLFADHLHIPHDPPLFSGQIRITVE